MFSHGVHTHSFHSKNKIKLLVFLLIIILITCTILLSDSSIYTSLKTDSKDAVTSDLTGNLKITMLDVGQGLSLLITCNDESMLYDGGGREASSYVVSYLEKHDIDELKYIVASHYDEDHIAGLVGVLSKYTVDKAITPDYTADTKIYESFVNKIASNDVPEEHPDVGDTYKLGKAKFEVLGPAEYTQDDDNDNSIVIRLSFGDFSCIITGDAQEKEEGEIIDSDENLSSILYVVGHHGSSSSTSSAFLDAISPEYAFISVGSDNSYGHPTRKTLNRLKKAGVKIFRTDKQQEVSVKTDGKTWKFSTDPCDDWSCGTYTATTEAKTNSGENTDKSDSKNNSYTYVVNHNTGKFHYPECKSVKQMKESNKDYVSSTREELIQKGYQPCGNCKP